MKTVFALVALLAIASAYQYDNVSTVTRSDVYVSCAFATYHMWSIYGNMILNNYETFLNMILTWLKDNVLYVLLTPYIQDGTDLIKAEALWAWFTATVDTHGCCGLSMFTYLTNTLVTEIWGRIDVDQFKSLLWQNLNKYKTEGQFYYDQFFMTCPFAYNELWYNYIQPYWPL